MESTLQIVITQLDVSCLVTRTQGALRKKTELLPHGTVYTKVTKIMVPFL